MGLTKSEHVALTSLGAFLLIGLGVLLWQQHRQPLVIISAPVGVASWDRRLAAARQVDVNTADASELERLPGVGPALARRIVEERTARGRFASPEDLTRVRGIGTRTVEELRGYVSIAEE